MPGLLADSGAGTLLSTTWRAARLSVAPGTSTRVVPSAAYCLQVSPVSSHRSSLGSFSVTVTVFPLVRSRVSLPPALRFHVLLVQGEPASVDVDVKPNAFAGALPDTTLVMVKVRTCCSEA